MSALRTLLGLVVLLVVALVFPEVASAKSAIQAQSHVGVFDLDGQVRTGVEADAGARVHRGFGDASYDFTSRSPHAARVAPRSAGAAESALSIAQRGGRHSGFLRQASAWTRGQLTRASRNFQRQIELHEAKIANPSDFVPNWGSMGARHQQGLIRKWGKEIDNFADQQSIVEALLR